MIKRDDKSGSQVQRPSNTVTIDGGTMQTQEQVCLAETGSSRLTLIGKVSIYIILRMLRCLQNVIISLASIIIMQIF